MKEEYSFKYKNIISHLKYIMSWWVLYFIFFFVYIYRNGYEESIQYLFLFAIGLTIFTAPIITIVTIYYVTNRNDKIIVDRENKTISIIRSQTLHKHEFSDIISFERTLTPTLFRGESSWYPWESLNYTKINFNNGDEYYISCLLINLFDLELPENIKTKRSKVFAFFS